MRQFSGMIRSKPDWWQKVNDPELVAKWREEMVEQDRAAVDKFWGGDLRFDHGHGSKKWPRDPLTDAQLDYIFEELKYEASQRDEGTGIFATSIPMVYESRDLIPADLRSSLISGVSVLESVPDDQKDWHPRSNKQVLDLVHPSLYCLCIGHSYVRTDATNSVHVISNEEYLARRPDLEKIKYWKYMISPLYQWLPTDFEVSDSGDVRPLGYINNLHPSQHRALYPTISSILSRFVPLFDKVLSAVLSPEPPYAVKVDPYEWYNHLKEPESFPDVHEDEYYDALDEWHSKYNTANRIDLTIRGRTVQVIVKLANIVLTPENPRYPGGAWHVEGMANEKIVATGLYYYACENITQSRLDFRTAVGDGEESTTELAYEQNDEQGYYAAYGFANGDALNQGLGHIVAEEGKCVAFPNIYQHHVDAFELADPTKPGHRKILCFFLVDPFTRILSTSDVPPQQEGWTMNEMLRAPALLNLPVELFDLVADYTKTATMSRAEAEEHREKLMAERANFVIEQNEKVFEMEFNMCEH
ncbi:hypothetical protein BD413DRAFT_656192 [Trametes elegans]|nr:hypothetical protein BD413DRAFT_656192 [Trametes elegans]